MYGRCRGGVSPAISKKLLVGVSFLPPHTPRASSSSACSSPKTTAPLQSVQVLLASHRMCEHTPQASGSQGGGLIGGDGGLGGVGGDGGGGGGKGGGAEGCGGGGEGGGGKGGGGGGVGGGGEGAGLRTKSMAVVRV